ncbi:hypothetical protein EJ05DRAFT_494741 [Pseudovirgaria hyperparasitica]|uniref:sterol 3beta-glucosyltransferase n=1 Tax=Pseudovirgaria hyperparasitica TaxID=470096 RepID=A0A6A6VVE5_9PEZI|nr:uncharacterized protein EJ05DRAFT_494741 [Pseudovirgaria hyperparasitica]KAF2753590.1 hypothetical protein EJ05DRAFT_494741 [Pseudovirgaria hyperparasitica]
MSSEDGLRAQTGRKLTKRRKDFRRVSLDIPEKFKDGADIEEDASAAPKGQETWTMNQSLFSMIAKTGSQADLHTPLEEVASSDSDGEHEGRLKSRKRGDAAQYMSPPRHTSASFANRHRRKISDSKLLKSLPRLRTRREARDASNDQDMSTSQILPPKPAQVTASRPSRESALLDTRPTHIHDSDEAGPSRPTASRRGRHESLSETSESSPPPTLAQRLQDIFEFEELEEVISQYPCWLIQSVLLQGYLYITQKHICFYAYLNRKDPGKSGYIAKLGRSKYNRYWFVLKGDVLAYYNNTSDLYFPRNRINLSHAISASIIDQKDKDKEATSFVVETEGRNYTFKADSATSALDWVRAIQKVIFRTRNDGGSVKISIPLQNVWDIEENPLMDFADSIKIRVIDNGETYAMDEYFFSFSGSAEDVLNILRILIPDNDPSVDGRSSTCSPRVSSSVRPKHLDVKTDTERSVSPGDASPLRENVKATLSPRPPVNLKGSSPRISMESSRSSLDMRRRSTDITRTFQKTNSDRGRTSFTMNRSSSYGGDGVRRGDKSPLSPKINESSASASTSLDQVETESSAAIQSLDDTNASASQILNRTDVFHRPTIQNSSGQLDTEKDRMCQSQETARSVRDNKRSPLPTVGDDDDSDQQNSKMRDSDTSAIQNIVQAGSYPLQKASGLLGNLKSRSKRMSKVLSTETMGYYEKVAGMWAGGRKHYHTAEGLSPDDQIRSAQEDADAVVDAERFREHFALPPTEELQSTFFGSLQRVIPMYGKIYISDRHFCFRSMLPTTRTKLILPLKDIETVEKEKGFRLSYYGLVIVIRGFEEVFFEFAKAELRDECTVTTLRQLENVRFMTNSQSLHQEDVTIEEQAKAEHDLLQEARAEPIPQSAPIDAPDTDPEKMPLIFDDLGGSYVDFKPSESLKITCLTIGSRGDVQPYIAFCKGLLAEGHKPKIVTHAEFEHAVREQGIDFAPVAGDPAELMRICIENGMFTYSFIREASEKFRGWIDGLLATAWEACQGSDILIESPSAMAGIHIAEALRIPYFRAFGMTWTRTRAYPHAFFVPGRRMGGNWNSWSYSVFDKFFWGGISGQVNHWRRNTLKLPKTGLGKMKPDRRPFMYFVSPSVMPPPLDWPDWIRVTGYWFLDTNNDYVPPQDLVDFLAKARKDKKKIVYIGFGSIVVDDPAAMTKTVVDAVLKADVRCVLSKGWSDRLDKKDAAKPELPLPSDIFQIKEAPHDWLFKQVDAAVHHGGSGTTGASLRAGIPTVIKPFFGDQFFYGMRVENLNVGVCIEKINTTVLGRAIWTATNDQRMIDKAALLGEKIRKESGVQTAIQTMYRELERARTFIPKDESPDVGYASAHPDPTEDNEDWTLVDDEDACLDTETAAATGYLKYSEQALARAGGSSAMALGSMVLRGAGVSGKR